MNPTTDIKKKNNCSSSNNRRKYKESKEQFYTKENIIENCVQASSQFIASSSLPLSCLDFSAGNNKFNDIMKTTFSSLVEYHAYDIDPKNNNIIKQDFLTVSPFHVDIIGFNPPFGYQSCTAKVFLEHASKFTPLFLLLILPYSNKYIYPKYYEEIFVQKLDENSFYIPNTLKTIAIRNCKFVILKYNATFIPKKEEKEIEIKFHDMKRLPRSIDATWHSNFKQGFAVRRIGVNSGKQIIIWNGSSGIFIDQNQQEHIISNFINKDGILLSCAAFLVYQTNLPISVEFAKKLWNELRNHDGFMNHALLTALSPVTLSRCIQNII